MERTFASIADLLNRHGVRLRGAGGDSLRGQCPLSTHSSKRSNNSFWANLTRNVWACHSASCIAARGGKIGGRVQSLAVLLGDQAPYSAPHLVLPQTSNAPLPFVLKGIDCEHPYLAARGISATTARHFGAGYFPGRGLMNGRVVIPIHDELGRLVAYAGRSLSTVGPKYRFPRGFQKGLALFNLHRVQSEEVLIVEGFFDCMRVWQSGWEVVIALMGCSLSPRQEKMVVERFRRVTLLLDGDDAGRQGAERVATRLIRSLHVRIVDLPTANQPDALTEVDLARLLST